MRLAMNRLLPLLFFMIATLPLYAADSTQPVFIRSRCDKKLSSVVLSSLKDAITASGKYRVVSGLDNDGKLDVVHTIYMRCAENNDVTAVATQYGIAKCHNSKECGSVNAVPLTTVTPSMFLCATPTCQRIVVGRCLKRSTTTSA
jgi:hypothetical protein